MSVSYMIVSAWGKTMINCQPSNLGIPHVQTASHPQVPGPHVAASWKTPGKSLAEPRCPASIDVTRNLKARDEDGNDDDDDDDDDDEDDEDEDDGDDEEGEREQDKHG